MGVDVFAESTSSASELTRLQLEGLKLSIVLLLIGSPIGTLVLPTMKFSVANCFQIVSAIILLWSLAKYIRRFSVALFLSYIAGLIVAGFFLKRDFNVNVSLSHSLYFAVCIVCILLVWGVPKNEELYQSVRSALRIGVPTAILIMYGFAFRDMVINHLAYSSMGFDDKSHAAVYIAALAFLILELSRSFFTIPIAIFVFASSFLTVSRLSAIMIPFFLVAVFFSLLRIHLRISNKKTRCRFDIIMGIITVILLTVVFIVVKDLPVFSRLVSSGNGSASGSTQSHFILIRLALEMKFLKPWIVLFGVTPGAFSDLLPVSGIDYSGLTALDPGSQITMNYGALPVHSVPASIFLEFPIWIFIIYAIVLVLITINLIKEHKSNVWLMFLAVTSATVFYSGHNEPYFLTLFLISILFRGDLKSKMVKNSSVYQNIIICMNERILQQ